MIGVAAVAAEPARDRETHPRRHVMEIIGHQAETLRKMASGQSPFDARVARTAAGEISEYARRFPALYEAEGSREGEDNPKIWEDFDGFRANSAVLADLAETACADIQSLEDLQAAYDKIDTACRSCHSDFVN